MNNAKLTAKFVQARVGRSPIVLCSFAGLFVTVISLVLLLLLFLGPTNALATSEFIIPTKASVCLEPVEPSSSPIIARSLDQQKQLKDRCNRWSLFSGQTATFDALRFKSCPSRKQAVHRFTKSLFASFGQTVTTITSASLYDNPARSALTPVGDEESRSGSLIVWHSRMIALVIEDNASSSAERSDLGKIRIIYPSWDRCGELIETDAKSLSGDLKATLEPKFLRFKYPNFYWNSWFEDKDDRSDVKQIVATKQYRYVIDLSAFDYKNYRTN